MRVLLLFLLCLLVFSNLTSQERSPNILLVIADDLGIDAIEGFGIDGIKPNTPTLDSLREGGMTFTNCWATPQCTPTRAAIISGKYGVKTGVLRPPGPLDVEHTSIFNRIKESDQLDYAMSVFGKWHIGGNNVNHPAEHGVDHFEGYLGSGLSDYSDWEKVTNGNVSQESEYLTTRLTDAAIQWIQSQSKPWFLWLAHAAPHVPFHTPPEGLYTTEITDNRSRYRAMIEALDTEMQRLISSMDKEERRNTIIFFIGDNGTPNMINTFFPNGHVKGSIYEGGVRVPMIASGPNIKAGAIDESLVQVTDLHATILELMGLDLPGGIYNSLSLKPTLDGSASSQRNINYVDYNDDGRIIWATRTNRYKLIEDESGTQEFYDIIEDIKEEENLINILTTEQEAIKNMLSTEAANIRSSWSCIDGIQNGTESSIDNCGNDCPVTDILSSENIGCCSQPETQSVYYEFVEENVRYIYTNSYPNHDFCFNTRVPEPNYKLYKVDINPKISDVITSVVRENGRPARYFGVANNGVFYMPAPALPFVFEHTVTGEYNWDWVFEPTTNQGEGAEKVSLDCASAHTNSNGYHYHGNMFEYIETISPGSSSTETPPEEPIHVGWASDGFPIVYRFGPDSEGNIKELLPSYGLKSGQRPGDGVSEPCGPYTGKYTRDFEYIEGRGDLNECNGINASITLATQQGEETFNFFYVVTEDFPQIPRCMVGFVSPDFDNSAPSLSGRDDDGDGFIDIYDCDDSNPMINPLAVEIEGNNVDENCDDLLTSTFDLSSLGMSLYPNPNNGSFWIRTNNDHTYDFLLFNINGVLIKRTKGQGEISFDNIQQGNYTLVIQDKGVTIGSSKVVVI